MIVLLRNAQLLRRANDVESAVQTETSTEQHKRDAKGPATNDTGAQVWKKKPNKFKQENTSA